MILFAADNHYDTHAGRILYDAIKQDYPIEFHEDQWDCFNQSDLGDKFNLIALNFISGCCHIPMPDPAAEGNVRRYLEAGGHLLLLHGASAAFWQWDWWRPIVGHRWVRGNDPEGFDPSTHPRRPYRVEVAKSRHPLCSRLRSVDMPEDEIYTNLEQTCPTSVLMTTTTDEGTFPMCYEAHTPWGGRILSYLPGHDPAGVQHPDGVHNCKILIDDLVNPGTAGQ